MAEETKEVDRTPRNLSLSNYAPHARKLVDDIKVGKRVINGHKIPEPDWANDECAFYCEGKIKLNRLICIFDLIVLLVCFLELGLCRTTRTDVTVAGLFFQYATNCLKRCENEFSLELFAGSDWIAGGSELDAIKARLFALESVVEEIKDGNSYLIRDAKAVSLFQLFKLLKCVTFLLITYRERRGALPDRPCWQIKTAR